MDCKFIVFVEDPKDTTISKIIKTFRDLLYTVLVDARHVYDYKWIYDNTEVGRLFIFKDNNLLMYDREDLEIDMKWHPDFAITFNDWEKVDSQTWEAIRLYCQQHLTDEMIDMTNTMKVHEILGKPLTVRASLPEPEKVEYPEYYSFQSRHLESQDIMLYEVVKPFTDLPYTSVTRKYSLKGHLPFFTDLFICQSWGVARADIAFLKHMWSELQMDGEFDLESLMKDATERCLPAEDRFPDPEPEVYRRSLEDTILILKEKALGTSRFIPNKN